MKEVWDHFTLPERHPDYPVDYVLDDQQRITSIFGDFQTRLEFKKLIECKRYLHKLGSLSKS